MTRRVLSGAVAGAAATIPMSLVMLAARRAGIMRRRQPPEQIVERTAAAVNARPDRKTIRGLAVVSHFAFGALAGAAFGTLARGPRPALVAQGMLFGSGVWLVSYRGWLPEMGLMPEAERDEPGRRATMIAAHLVYGASLGAIRSVMGDLRMRRCR